MIAIFKRRRARKKAKHCLHHARHCRRMREDIADAAALARLQETEASLQSAMKGRDVDAMDRGSQEAFEAAIVVMPARPLAWLRENVEIFVVAIAVAMAFRTYFIQPFKIPTGSMQPSLYGITSEYRAEPQLFDRPGLKMLKWLVLGEYYHEYRAQASGVMSDFFEDKWDPSIVHCTIGGIVHKLPVDALRNPERRHELGALPGNFVARGTLLWSGLRRAGDHVFVDRVRWNFFPPKRGQVMVFETASIPTLPPGMHYIKRLVGLPGETITIHPPNVLVNGEILEQPQRIATVASRAAGYDGYTLADPRSKGPRILGTPDDSLTLSDKEYLALGDNTRNSKDSRYWGGVPQKNLVGPAVLVYWPFSKRWGPLCSSSSIVDALSR